MSHLHQQKFVESVKSLFPQYFQGKSVLEVGSLNVNGTIRDFFEGCDYIGIDCQSGNCVDHVCLAHEYAPDEAEIFDVVCSCEAFEHDPYLARTVRNMFRLLKRGGLFFSTCATVGRGEHGTMRTTGEREIYGPKQNYYKNVESGTLLRYLSSQDLRTAYVNIDPGPRDLYCFAIKES